MPVRNGGSWIRDPKSGELTPNSPADEAAETAPAAGDVVVTVTPPMSEMSPETAAAVGKLIEVAATNLVPKSSRRKAQSEET